MQSDLSVENGLFRLNESQINWALLRSRKRAFSTQLFSTENSDWRIQSKNNATSSTGSSSRKTRSKKFYTCFLNRSHRPSHHQTHTHTTTHPYQVPHCSIIQGADAGLAIPAVACRRKSAWHIPNSTRQQRVSHDGSSARSRSHADNNGCACCSFGGSRLSATPRT